MVFYVCGVPVAGVQEAQAMYAIAVAGGAFIQAQAIADIVEHHLDLGHDQHMIVNAIMHSYVEKLS